ncbi:hypothetical protein [Polynucleobacter sp.]|uniref:hypothetical protein n=1 Tax=Polynucleobacter sp. TaxID=2029855 RepID=UPI003F6A27D1
MDDGMDKKQVDANYLVQKIAWILADHDATPRFLRTHFDEIEQEFEDRKDK